MELITMQIADIVPYENNPRRNDGAVDAVAESIKQCGYIAPIIVDEDNVVLAGHTRLKALQQLGYKECNVAVVTGLTEEQKRKYRLLDNKTNEFAEWDFELLQGELEGLDFADFDFGFGLDVNDNGYAGGNAQQGGYYETSTDSYIENFFDNSIEVKKPDTKEKEQSRYWRLIIDCHDEEQLNKVTEILNNYDIAFVEETI